MRRLRFCAPSERFEADPLDFDLVPADLLADVRPALFLPVFGVLLRAADLRALFFVLFAAGWRLFSAMLFLSSAMKSTTLVAVVCDSSC
ncbi:MAG: hypothetical protein WBW61_11030, partial [Rhodanobacteraceae bacterium]